MVPTVILRSRLKLIKAYVSLSSYCLHPPPRGNPRKMFLIGQIPANRANLFGLILCPRAKIDGQFKLLGLGQNYPKHEEIALEACKKVRKLTQED